MNGLGLALCIGIAWGAVIGILIGIWIAPRKRVQRSQIDAAALAKELVQQGGIKLTVQTDCDAIAAAIVDAERRAEQREALH